jgi:hypothetical protein
LKQLANIWRNWQFRGGNWQEIEKFGTSCKREIERERELYFSNADMQQEIWGNIWKSQCCMIFPMWSHYGVLSRIFGVLSYFSEFLEWFSEFLPHESVRCQKGHDLVYPRLTLLLYYRTSIILLYPMYCTSVTLLYPTGTSIILLYLYYINYYTL